MNVTLNLDADTVRRLREQAARSGRSLEAYLEGIAADLAGKANGTQTERRAEEWIADLRAWAASQRSLPQLADDSRESMYADRSE